MASLINCMYLLAFIASVSYGYERLNKFISHFEVLDMSEFDQHKYRRLFVKWSTLPHGDTLFMKFKAFGRTFNLILKMDMVTLASNAKITDDYGNRLDLNSNTLVTGKAVHDDASQVYGWVTYSGLFTGVIKSQNETYYIEPAGKYFKEASFYSIIYRSQDIPHSLVFNLSFTADGSVKQKRVSMTRAGLNGDTHHRHRRRASTNPKICWLSLEADYSFLQMSGSRLHAIRILVNHMQGLNKIFYKSFVSNEDKPTRNIFTQRGNDSVVQFQISRVRVYNETETSRVLARGSFDAATFLRLMQKKGGYSKYCLALFFTARSFTEGVFGVANPGGACTSLNAGVVSFTREGMVLPTLVTEIALAHVVGHAFGAKRPLKPRTGDQFFLEKKLKPANVANEVEEKLPMKTCDGKIVPLYGAEEQFTLFTPVMLYLAAFTASQQELIVEKYDHDPDNNCQSASGKDGPFIMTRFGLNADEPNSSIYSACSTQQIKHFINKLPVKSCLDGLSTEQSLCGNGVIESVHREECDCGDEKTCRDLEPGNCCNYTTCRLRKRALCSVSNGLCCDAKTCSYKNAGEVCSLETECSYQATCSGNTSTCPEPSYKENFLECNRNTSICMDGICGKSVCEKFQLNACFCERKMDECKVCCFHENKCQPAQNITKINSRIKSTYLSAGSLCRNRKGYCDVFHDCHAINLDAPFSPRYDPYFRKKGIKEITHSFWWAIFLGTVGLIACVVMLIKHGALYTRSSNPDLNEREPAKKLPRIRLSRLKEEEQGIIPTDDTVA